jgi:hypothetical protein
MIQLPWYCACISPTSCPCTRTTRNLTNERRTFYPRVRTAEKDAKTQNWDTLLTAPGDALDLLFFNRLRLATECCLRGAVCGFKDLSCIAEYWYAYASRKIYWRSSCVPIIRPERTLLLLTHVIYIKKLF